MSGKKDFSNANKGLPSLRLAAAMNDRSALISRAGGIDDHRFSFVESIPVLRRHRIQIFEDSSSSSSSSSSLDGIYRSGSPTPLENNWGARLGGGGGGGDLLFNSATTPSRALTSNSSGRNYGLSPQLLKEEEEFMRTPLRTSTRSNNRNSNLNNDTAITSSFAAASNSSNHDKNNNNNNNNISSCDDSTVVLGVDGSEQSSVGSESLSYLILANSQSQPDINIINTTTPADGGGGSRPTSSLNSNIGSKSNSRPSTIGTVKGAPNKYIKGLEVSLRDSDTIGDELKDSFNDYFGAESRLGYVRKTRLAYNQVNRYDNEADLPAGASSAIHLYLREVNVKKIIPMSCGVLRKESNPKGVFLPHKGLGDTKMLPVINVLDKLPCVETIDLCDNRLTDVSLMPLSIKLNSMKSLTHLDLSFNKIDDSSETIMEFLKSPTCPLKVLLLNGADVDDGESVNLFEALADNRLIHTLGLSNNMIGNTENETATNPDLRTGGQALRDMLSKNRAITKLDISWNCIRLTSAVEVGSSLETNATLTSLNLSHNSFGDIGTQMVGRAIRNNKSLTELDIQANSLTPKSATVLANGLFYNESLLTLRIDGNILGEVGTQAMVAAIQRSAFSDEPRRLQVSFNGCDCKKVVPGLFNAAAPGGLWDLDMSEPYGQMVVEECFFLANYRAGCSIEWMNYNKKPVQLERSILEDKNNKISFDLEAFFSSCKHAASDTINENFESGSEHMRVLLNQFQFLMMGDMRMKVLRRVRENWFLKTSKSDRNDLHEVFLFEVFYALFILNDIDNSGSMECNEFMTTLASLGKPSVDKDFAKRLMSEHDKDESGTIDANEFAMIMVNEFCRTDVPKGVLVDKVTKKPWVVPNSGRVAIKMIYECDAPSMFDVGRDEGIEAVIEAIREAKTVDQKEIIFEQATSSPYYFLSCDQGQMLYNEVIHMPSMSQMDVIAAILPQLVNEEQVCRFLDNNLDDYGKLSLRVRLGQFYNCYIGIGTGHYILDLKSHEKMQGIRRLSSIAVSESKFLKQLSMDTSQKGNKSNFRNEQISSNGIDFKPVEVDGTWFTSCPRSGTLKFDYASTTRPRQGTRPISDSRFERILELLDIVGIPEGVAALKAAEASRIAEANRPKYFDNAEVLEIVDQAPAEEEFNQTLTLDELINIPEYDFEAELNNLMNQPIVTTPLSTTQPASPLLSPSDKSNVNLADSKTLTSISVATTAAPAPPAPAPNGNRSRAPSMSNSISSDVESQSSVSVSYTVEAPLTSVFVKEHFRDMMDTCHHFWDIYPKEKLRDVSRSTYDPSRPLVTPPSMDIRPHPEKDVMPVYYPYVLRKLLQLTIMLPGIYFSIEQVCHLLKYFPKECYFRIQLLQIVFSKITDLENFDAIYDRLLDDDEQREAMHRIGIMNMLDPLRVDRNYCLDLRRMEHREMCKILIALAVAEPGENWVNEEYRWAKYDDNVPGWMLPATWALDDSDNDGDGGPRRHGWITLRYRSEGFGCAPVWEVRKNLRRRFLAGLKRIL